MKRFQNRTEAGQFLASLLTQYSDRADVLVLGLPRGGVPIAFEIAAALHVPLDIFLVRKLGVPGHEELAMGAIASGDVRVLNQDVVEMQQISDTALEQVTQREQQELQRREHLYRGDRPILPITDRIVILVDDGLATGATMRAAVMAVRQHQPQEVVVAVPVGARQAYEQLSPQVEAIICAVLPERFNSVGAWYEAFPQTSDREVCELLQRTQERTQDGASLSSRLGV
ncbi:phosphoribosyltransferase [Trichocoleus sp. FACHB-262]|uniref:phosphoribosyltransferase n=1 Tax=Trichocoleus sp. FACHB-262 TaxID=2692869 RepID=UPI001684D253|nr:phosphoribosyltransferase [Trichocoleus sp. FACHB-262]MBD2124354.1 phosphoribosyltransferase [Trichocoleus sp. FACHB-262]